MGVLIRNLVLIFLWANVIQVTFAKEKDTLSTPKVELKPTTRTGIQTISSSPSVSSLNPSAEETFKTSSQTLYYPGGYSGGGYNNYNSYPQYSSGAYNSGYGGSNSGYGSSYGSSYGSYGQGRNQFYPSQTYGAGYNSNYNNYGFGQPNNQAGYTGNTGSYPYNNNYNSNYDYNQRYPSNYGGVGSYGNYGSNLGNYAGGVGNYGSGLGTYASGVGSAYYTGQQQGYGLNNGRYSNDPYNTYYNNNNYYNRGYYNDYRDCGFYYYDRNCAYRYPTYIQDYSRRYSQQGSSGSNSRYYDGSDAYSTRFNKFESPRDRDRQYDRDI